MSESIEFFESKHVEYIKKVSNDRESFQYVVTQHLRMSGVYWGSTAMSILGKDIMSEMDGPGIVAWVLKCEDPKTGGFGGSMKHDPHMLYTLSAVQMMALTDKLDLLNADRIAAYIGSLQQPDGSFAGDCWGEVDTRFTYCAVNALSILGKLHSGVINIAKAVEYVNRYAIILSYMR
jgi:geranylgeranyl transferase type-2 subunit beta